MNTKSLSQKLIAATTPHKHSGFDQFVNIYKTYFAMVRAIVYRFGIRNDLEDVTQEVFLKAWKGYSSYKRSSSIKTWLTRITYNACIDHVRREKHNISNVSDDLELLKDRDDVASSVQNQQLATYLLSKLKPELRFTVLLSLHEEMAHKEISEVMNVPEGTVKSRLSTARKVLETEMKALKSTEEKTS